MRFAGFIFCGLLFVLGCSDASPEAVAKRAQLAYQQGQYSKSIELYERLLKISNEDAMIYYNLALAAYPTGDYLYAQKALERAVALAGDTEKALLAKELLAVIAEAKKETPEAIQIYRMLASKSTDVALQVRARMRLAAIYVGQQRHDSALAMLLGALNASPLDGTVSYDLGKLCMDSQMKLYPEALNYFQMAEKALPKTSPLLKDTRNCISQLTGYLERYRQVPAQTVDAAASTKAMEEAKTAMAKKQWRTAEDNYRKAVKANPNSFDTQLAYAQLCVKNAHLDEAVEAYKKAVALKPESHDTAFAAATAANQAKRYADALAFLRAALIAMPTRSAQADLMTRIQFAQRRTADARIWGEYYLSLVTQASAARDAYAKWVNNLPLE